MISQLNSLGVFDTYKQLDKKTDESSKKVLHLVQGDKNKIEEMKDKIASGEYRVDLETLSKKIAEDLI